MRLRLPSDPERRALHGFVLTIVAPVIGLGIVVYLATVAQSDSAPAYVAASSLVFGAFAKPDKPDDSDS